MSLCHAESPWPAHARITSRTGDQAEAAAGMAGAFQEAAGVQTGTKQDTDCPPGATCC